MMTLNDETLKKLTKGILIFLTILIAIYLSVLFLDIITMLVISVLLAFIFNPLVTLIEKQGIKRIIAVLIVLLVSIGLLTIAFGTLIPKITSQVNTIATKLSGEKVTQTLSSIEKDIHEFLPFLGSVNISEKLTEFLSSIMAGTLENISEILTSIVSVIALVFIVPFMTFFLLKDNTTIIKGIVNIMPNKYFEMSYSVIKKITLQLGKFVRAWILDALFVGTASAIGLTVLGIDNSITIGMIAGIGHLIPYFGPVIGGLPALIIATVQFGNLSMTLSIILMFLIIYTLDNGYIQPNLLAHGTDIHPLMIIVLILFGSQAMGVIGMLLAVPLATVIKTAAREIYFGYKNYQIIRT